MPITPVLTPVYDNHLDEILAKGRLTIRTRNPERTRRMISKRKWQRGIGEWPKLEFHAEVADPETWETEEPDFLLTVVAHRKAA